METIKATTIPALQSFAKENNLAMEVYKALSIRERSAARSDVDAIFRELEAGLKKELDYTTYMNVWRQFETLGHGTLVFGRKGNPNRFEWKVNFKALGRKILGLPETETPSFRPERLMPRMKQVEAVKDNTVSISLPPSVRKEDVMALFALLAEVSEKKVSSK